VNENSEFLNIDKTRIGLIGDNAGDNLTAVLTLLNNENKHPHDSKLLCLPYSILDLSLQKTSPSYKAYSNGEYFISHQLTEWSNNIRKY